MSAILKSIDDPRDALERARRPELVRFARANGVEGITSDMPAILIRRKLRDRGLTKISVPLRLLGQVETPTIVETQPSERGAVVDAAADLERQFAAQATKSPDQMSILELGAEMKRLNIKRDRRDNMATLRAKIEGHGKNALERGQ